MQLMFKSREIGCVFGYRQDENSATFALGWTLNKSPVLLAALLNRIDIGHDPAAQITIDMQRFGPDRGYTDLEIIGPDFHVIVEAKKFWAPPDVDQLMKYAGRFAEGVPVKMLVSLSAASAGYVRGMLPGFISGASVKHLAWDELMTLAAVSQSQTRRQEERLWLHELEVHLKGYASMQDPKDNTVYVVSLSSAPVVPGNPYSWIDVVARDGRYFHPMGINGWPVVPPNYLGIRYNGQLQAVHHISSHEVERDLSAVNPLWPKTDKDHFIYMLGPAMRPAQQILNGAIYPNGRYRCAIDTLLSGEYATIAAARDETNRRLAENGIAAKPDDHSSDQSTEAQVA